MIRHLLIAGVAALVIAAPAAADPRKDDNKRFKEAQKFEEQRYKQREKAFKQDNKAAQKAVEQSRKDYRRWVKNNNVTTWVVYDWNRPDVDGYYYADRYYRPVVTYRTYRPIVVTRQTRIYRGSDNRYYCRRSDGTTGLIVGAAIGGVIGSRLDRGRSNLLGTLLGAGAGAVIGQSIDRGSVTCR